MTMSDSKKTTDTLGYPKDIPIGFMVLDGKIVVITEEHILEGFKNCTTLTSLEAVHMPDSITSAAFVVHRTTLR